MNSERFFLTLLISTLAVLIGAYLLPGVTVTGFWVALVTAVVIGLFNAVLRPVLVLLTLPITIMSLGLFMLVINALLIMLASAVIPGFSVANFWWALLFSIVLAVLNSFLGGIGKERRSFPRP